MKNDKNKCPETSSTLILYLYGEAGKPAQFEAHLENCATCRATLADHRKTLDAYRSESVEVPVFDIAPTPSIIDRLTDMVADTFRRPVFAGGLALAAAAALVVWIAVKSPEPIPVAKGIPSYSDMTTDVEALDDDLDNMFVMNGYSQVDWSEDQSDWSADVYDEESDDDLNNILDELDDIRQDIQIF